MLSEVTSLANPEVKEKLRLDLHSRINPGGVGKKSFRLIYTFSPERGPEYARVNFIGGSIRNTSTSRQRAFQK